jgi:MoxR-like ATPase
VTSTPLLPGDMPAPDAGAGLPRDFSGALARAIVSNVQRVVHGRAHAVELVACAVLAGGHALIEDVPGSGKTTLARAFARSMGGTFHRIQATADLLPADITGSGVWDPDSRRFHFVPGPLFAHVVLADELNRTTPRTQSAFLEAMDEGAVTVDGIRHPLPDPFFVVATQNPLEQHGTYPLPEGQLDRFAVCLRLGGIDHDSERQVVIEQLVRPTVDDLDPVADPERLRAARTQVRLTHIAGSVLEHALALVRATRSDPRIVLGASSRAALVLLRCAQARALLYGRDYVTPDDTKALAGPVLAHRLLLANGVAPGFPAGLGGAPTLAGAGGFAAAQYAESVVADLVARIPVPVQ